MENRREKGLADLNRRAVEFGKDFWWHWWEVGDLWVGENLAR